MTSFPDFSWQIVSSCAGAIWVHPAQIEGQRKGHTHTPVLECVPPSELRIALKAQPEPRANSGLIDVECESRDGGGRIWLGKNNF